jgi:hypothetical protein
MKHKPPPRCSRCDDHGLVVLDRRLEQKPGEFRWVVEVYRCDCPAGYDRSKAYNLAPPLGDVVHEHLSGRDFSRIQVERIRRDVLHLPPRADLDE